MNITEKSKKYRKGLLKVEMIFWVMWLPVSFLFFSSLCFFTYYLHESLLLSCLHILVIFGWVYGFLYKPFLELKRTYKEFMQLKEGSLREVEKN